MDSFFYTGQKANPGAVKRILAELNSSGGPNNSQQPFSFPITEACFPEGADVTRRRIWDVLSIESKGSLPVWRHIIERTFVSIIGVTCLTATRHSPVRTKYESLEVTTVTRAVNAAIDVIAGIIKACCVAAYLLNDVGEAKRQALDVFFAAFLPFIALQVSSHVREAIWFSKALRAKDQEVLKYRDRLSYRQLSTAGSANISAREYVKMLGTKVGDMELNGAILIRESLASEMYSAAGGQKTLARSNSMQERMKAHAERMNEKYTLQASTFNNSFTILSGVVMVLVILAGPYLHNDGNFVPDGVSETTSRSALMAQLIVSALLAGFSVIFCVHSFIMEAVNDCQAHNRLFAAFLHSIGALTHNDVLVKGHAAPDYDETDELSSENLKVTVETAEDLETAFLVRDFLYKYIHLRTAFHGAFFGMVVFIMLAIAGAFLLSSLYAGNMGTGLYIMMVWLSLMLSAAMIVALRPVIKTSRLLQEEWLRFLVEKKLFLRSELVSGVHGDVSEKYRRTFENQIKACDDRIDMQRICPSHLKILGVVATSGSLAKLIATVAGSIFSGLMRQANGA
jgi:hypothetical protein